MKKNSFKTGFTIIELLIVIIIIGILVGVAVPYYNDYIYDSRLSVLKQNLATMRSTINQFRGDRGRGPFRVTVQEGNSDKRIFNSSNQSTGSELVAGPYYPKSGGSDYGEQTNLKYLNALPMFVDPVDGSDMVNTLTPTDDYILAFIDDDGDGKFDIDTEFAFVDANFNEEFNTNEDVYLNKAGLSPSDGDSAEKLDYVDFTVKGNGTTY